MKQKKSILSTTLAFILTFIMLLNSNIVQAVEKQKSIPEVKYVNEPILEYTAGDIVNFNLYSPNYGGRVQYRVILWDDNKKEGRDLWTSGDRYYSKWIPYGNNFFNLHFRIDEPGAYRITVYVKRADIKNSNTALKGQNCDSYMESQAFIVKAKTAALDKDGQTYGSIDKNKIEAYKNDIYITAQNVTFNNASIEGNLTLSGNNAIIKNVNISGKLVIDPGIDGSCTLENVTAKAIEVLSGGKNSIHIIDSNIGTMDVNSQSPVRIEVDGDTEIVSTSASGYVIFDRKNGTYGTITVTKAENGQSVVEFRGDIRDKIVVETAATIKTGEASSIADIVINTRNSTDTVKLEGQFGKVKIISDANQGEASNTRLEVAANSKIENIIANNNTVINIDKTASVLNVQREDSEAANNGDGNTNNEDEYIPPTVRVSAIIVKGDKDATKIINGSSLQMSAALTPSNATNKTITWSITNGTGSASISGNGLLTATGVGTVTVKATNPASNITGSLVVTIIAPDKTALTAAINAEYIDGKIRTIKALTEIDYTLASWNIYADAITAAIAVEGNANALQLQIDTAAAAIGAAKGDLAFAGKADLDTAKAAASGKTEAEYTPISWDKLEVALALLETTNVEVVKKTNDINSAIGLLAKRGIKTALTTAINAEYADGAARVASALAEADYTTASWNTYTNAIIAAIAAEGNVNALQQQVDDAAAAIGTAKNKLIFAGTAGLDIAKAAAKNKVQADYTTDSWTAYEGAMTTANALSETTNKEVSDKALAINNAIDLLVKRGIKTALTAAINAEYTDGAARTARTLAEADYTWASWSAYADAITTAIAVEGNANALQLQIDTSVAAIGTAKGELVFAGRADLDTAKAEASGKIEAEYTPISWDKLEVALSLPETTNVEVVKKTNDINSAIGLLAKRGIKTVLTAAINAEYTDGEARTIKALTGADYTISSWNVYTNALTAAISVEGNANALQQQVDDAAGAIGTAKTALIFANKAAFDSAVASLGTIKEEKYYTVTSWAGFASAKNTALAMPEATNSEIGAKATALNSARALLVERVAETLNSIGITNFSYETIYATQARIESKVIESSDFGPGKNKSFAVADSSGNVIPINLTWNIPALVNDLPATYAAVVGSAVESFIQQYFVDKGGAAGLSNRTLWASGFGDTFSIGAFGPGPTGKITISGTDASYFFNTLQATGTGDDYSKNRTFTVSDGTNTATITLNSSYTNMDNLVNRINSMLGATKAVAVKIDESHFKLVAKDVWTHITIGGVNNSDFFSSFESQ